MAEVVNRSVSCHEKTGLMSHIAIGLADDDTNSFEDSLSAEDPEVRQNSSSINSDSYPRFHFSDRDVEEAWYLSGTQRRYKKMLIKNHLWREPESAEDDLRIALLRVIAMRAGVDSTTDISEDEERWKRRGSRDIEDDETFEEALLRHLIELDRWRCIIGCRELKAPVKSGASQVHQSDGRMMDISCRDARAKSVTQILGETMLACIDYNQLDLIPQLLIYDVLINQQVVDFFGFSEGYLTSTAAVHRAIENENEVALECLLFQHGADANVKSYPEQNPAILECARYPRRASLLKMLLLRGADPNATDMDGFTTLHTVLIQMFPHSGFLSMEEFSDYFRVLEILLDAGASLAEQYCVAQFGDDDRHILQPIAEAIEAIYARDRRNDACSDSGPERSAEPTKNECVMCIKKILTKLVSHGLDLNAWIEPDYEIPYLLWLCCIRTYAPEFIGFLVNHGMDSQMLRYWECNRVSNHACRCHETSMLTASITWIDDHLWSDETTASDALSLIEEMASVYSVLIPASISHWRGHGCDSTAGTNVPVTQRRLQSRLSPCEERSAELVVRVYDLLFDNPVGESLSRWRGTSVGNRFVEVIREVLDADRQPLTLAHWCGTVIRRNIRQNGQQKTRFMIADEEIELLNLPKRLRGFVALEPELIMRET